MKRRFFFDTSALVKLYHEENGTQELTSLLFQEKPRIVISDLAIIEMISALAKKVRIREIDILAFNEAVSAFDEDVLRFEVIEIESQIKKRASDLLKSVGLENGLRTLGSLQLASALAFSEFSTLSLFVASDAAIIHAARLLGLKTMAS
ncbi:MAG: type II toxin-antitoxin system VapC family toxin [Desulfococcaceae bacterium]